jgi:hypothetical protein
MIGNLLIACSLFIIGYFTGVTVRVAILRVAKSKEDGWLL